MGLPVPPKPKSYLVEGKSLYHHPFVGVLTDGKGQEELALLYSQATEAERGIFLKSVS